MASNRLADLSQLDNLDQAAILEALRSRYSRDEIYVSKMFHQLFITELQRQHNVSILLYIIQGNVCTNRNLIQLSWHILMG